MSYGQRQTRLYRSPILGDASDSWKSMMLICPEVYDFFSIKVSILGLFINKACGFLKASGLGLTKGMTFTYDVKYC